MSMITVLSTIKYLYKVLKTCELIKNLWTSKYMNFWIVLVDNIIIFFMRLGECHQWHPESATRDVEKIKNNLIGLPWSTCDPGNKNLIK